MPAAGCSGCAKRARDRAAARSARHTGRRLTPAEWKDAGYRTEGAMMRAIHLGKEKDPRAVEQPHIY